jgi:hypothetical protein
VEKGRKVCGPVGGQVSTTTATVQRGEDGRQGTASLQVHGPMWTKHDEAPKCEAYPGVPQLIPVWTLE